MLSVTNKQVAILNKVNELAERYGLKPTDFNAALQLSEDWKLEYNTSPKDPEKKKQFDKMLKSLGVDTNQQYPSMVTEADNIYTALEKAISLAPRARTKER